MSFISCKLYLLFLIIASTIIINHVESFQPEIRRRSAADDEVEEEEAFSDTSDSSDDEDDFDFLDFDERSSNKDYKRSAGEFLIRDARAYKASNKFYKRTKRSDEFSGRAL